MTQFGGGELLRGDDDWNALVENGNRLFDALVARDWPATFDEMAQAVRQEVWADAFRIHRGTELVDPLAEWAGVRDEFRAFVRNAQVQAHLYRLLTEIAPFESEVRAFIEELRQRTATEGPKTNGV